MMKPISIPETPRHFQLRRRTVPIAFAQSSVVAIADDRLLGISRKRVDSTIVLAELCRLRRSHEVERFFDLARGTTHERDASTASANFLECISEQAHRRISLGGTSRQIELAQPGTARGLEPRWLPR